MEKPAKEYEKHHEKQRKQLMIIITMIIIIIIIIVIIITFCFVSVASMSLSPLFVFGVVPT